MTESSEDAGEDGGVVQLSTEDQSGEEDGTGHTVSSVSEKGSDLSLPSNEEI